MIPIAGSALTNLAFIIIMTYAWNFALQAGLNQGVITTLMNFLSIFDCVIFYFAFGEKISKLHLVGVAFMFAGVACIGAAAATQDSADIDEDLDTGGRS